MTLLEMSLAGGVLIAVTGLLRALLGDRLPRRTFLALWGVTLARLLVPWEVPTPVSVYNVAPTLYWRPAPALSQAAPAGAADGAGGADSLALLWLAGAVICVGFFLVSWARCRLEFREALPVEDPSALEWAAAQGLRRRVELRRSDRISAPLTYGLLRPVILLPSGVDWSDQRRAEYVLTHEFVHIRRWDGAWKLLLTAAVCLHWFNPLVWLMYALANRDLELSCDQTVVRRMGEGARQGYALALLDLEEARSSLRPLCNHFSKNAIEERIKRIMDRKETTVWAVLAALVVVVGVAAAFATTGENSLQKTSVPSATSTNQRQYAAAMTVASTQEAAMGTELEPDPETGHYYTKEQYELVAALKTEHDESQSIAQFNRALWAKVNDGGSDEGEAIAEALWRVQEDLPADDPLAQFLHYTVRASVEEYRSRLSTVMNGKEDLPAFTAEARRVDYADVYGDQVQVGWMEVQYAFTYEILDQDGLTVAQRDQFLTGLTAGMQSYLEGIQAGEYQSDEALERAVKTELDRLGQAGTTEKIAYRSGQIDWAWSERGW